MGAKLVHVRKATLTVAANMRPACHFCGNCMVGCDVVAKYNSADVHLAPAEQTGFVTVFSDGIVREVLVSDENRAIGVRYLHRLHKNLTADGYYTSRVGLLDELGYAGNTMLPKFSGCSFPSIKKRSRTADHRTTDHGPRTAGNGRVSSFAREFRSSQ